jgi:1-acyl-sn-glycerol-3-phosphate acyltransferase
VGNAVNKLPYGTLRAFLTPFLMLLFRPKVKGLRHVPATGPVILAANHLSFSDSIFIPLVVPRKVTYLAKSEYFTGGGIKGKLQALTFHSLGQVPVDRSGGRRSEAALLTGLKILGQGDCLGIYPEGTRSPDGRLYKGRTGIARLAMESGAPVIPVAVADTDKVQPSGKLIPSIHRVSLTFGEPMYFTGDANDLQVLRDVTDEIMEKIQEMSGQEYVDTYASTVKDQAPRD